MRRLYKAEYGATLRQLAEQFAVTHQTIRQWTKNGTLQHAIDTGSRPKYNTKFRRQYGATLRQLAVQIGVTHETIRRWATMGTLQHALDTGCRPKYNCKFRRLYGANLEELAARHNCSNNKIWLMHVRGELERLDCGHNGSKKCTPLPGFYWPGQAVR